MPRIKCPMCNQSTDAAGDQCQFCGHVFDAERITKEEEVLTKAASAELNVGKNFVPTSMGGADDQTERLQRDAETTLYVGIGAVFTAGILGPLAFNRGRKVNRELAKIGMPPSAYASWGSGLGIIASVVWAVAIFGWALDWLLVYFGVLHYKA